MPQSDPDPSSTDAERARTPDVVDWRRAAHALATAPESNRSDVYQCGPWLAMTHEGRILGVHDDGALAAASLGAAREYAVSLPEVTRKPVRGTGIDVRAWTVPSTSPGGSDGRLTLMADGGQLREKVDVSKSPGEVIIRIDRTGVGAAVADTLLERVDDLASDTGGA